MTRPGKDLTLIGYSRMAHVAAEVAASLAESDGLDIEVVDLRSLRPLDRETIVASVRKTHAAVVLEDDWLTYGIGAEVAASISDGAFDYLDAPVRRVAMAEVPMPYSKTLETAALPSRDDVIAAIRQTLAAVGHRTAPLALGVPAVVIEIKMPRLSDTMEEGAISTWRKQPGDTVAVGDVLVEIETDKAVMEYEAYQAGTLAQILVPEGSNADIGAPIALLDDGAGRPAATAPAGSTSTASAERSQPALVGPSDPPAPAPTPAGSASAQPGASANGHANGGGRQIASPLVRKLVRENHLDLSHVTGSGPGGRIIRADIAGLLSAPAPRRRPRLPFPTRPRTPRPRPARPRPRRRSRPPPLRPRRRRRRRTTCEGRTRLRSARCGGLSPGGCPPAPARSRTST